MSMRGKENRKCSLGFLWKRSNLKAKVLWLEEGTKCGMYFFVILMLLRTFYSLIRHSEIHFPFCMRKRTQSEARKLA